MTPYKKGRKVPIINTPEMNLATLQEVRYGDNIRRAISTRFVLENIQESFVSFSYASVTSFRLLISDWTKAFSLHLINISFAVLSHGSTRVSVLLMHPDEAPLFSVLSRQRKISGLNMTVTDLKWHHWRTRRWFDKPKHCSFWRIHTY